MKNENVMVSKLSVARKVERSRIWIEGKRLVANGFTVGEYFVAKWWFDKGEPVRLTLHLCNDTDIYDEAPRKVSGKGDKPIIDITGADVLENFGKKFTHVQVVYAPTMICISGTKAPK